MRRIGALLRRTDPMRGDPQPDARGEADLRLVVGEPIPSGVAEIRPTRPPVRTVLVTAVVAALVVGASAAAVIGVHSARTGAAGPTATRTIDGCDPVAVLPFQCGTYRSVYGASSVSGGAGGPEADPLTLSFSSEDGGLVLHASGLHCLDATIPLRAFVQSGGRYRLERAGAADIDQQGCTASAKAGWALAWLSGPLVVDAGAVGGLAFNSATALVTFDYEGLAPPGAAQLPRNDKDCIPAHVQPFACGEYRSTGGTGSLAFLSSDRYRLSFEHINGELTAVLQGSCNAISVVLEVAGNTAVALPGGSTAEACLGRPGGDELAILRFFDGTLSVRTERQRVVFTSGADSAAFTLPGV